jgi:GNAT superfamily N-acetyltransferase
MNPPLIRPAQAEDAPALARFVAEYRRESDPNADIAVVTANAAAQFRLALEQSHSHAVYVAGPTGEAQGYALVHWVPLPLIRGTEGYLSDLLVGRGYRGTGAGGALLEAVEADALRRGCVRLMLNNGKDAESYARGFYAKHGFTERVRVANFVKKF